MVRAALEDRDFFLTLKTGCRIEVMRSAMAERLANCVGLSCVAA
ncbi:MAG: hypothetical protein V7786_14810 [Sulfitobacter litoralis]